jgi:hypothetical protein
VRQARLRNVRGRHDHTIDRKRTCAANHQERRNGQRQQVIFESFALLGAGPVPEEPIAAVHHYDRDYHICCDSEGGDTCEESQDQLGSKGGEKIESSQNAAGERSYRRRPRQVPSNAASGSGRGGVPVRPVPSR